MEKSDVEEWINCKACKKMIKAKSIITHLSRSAKCRDIYGSEFDDMKAKRDTKRKEYLDKYKKEYNETNANKIKKKQSKYNSEKKKLRLQNEKQSTQVNQTLAKNQRNVDDPNKASPGIFNTFQYTFNFHVSNIIMLRVVVNKVHSD